MEAIVLTMRAPYFYPTTLTGYRGNIRSALTTACGFGNQAVSPHLGTATMGIMLTIAQAITLLYVLIVVPSFLTLMPLRLRTNSRHAQ